MLIEPNGKKRCEFLQTLRENPQAFCESYTYGRSLLHDAADAGDTEIIKIALQHSDIDFDGRSFYGYTPLMYATLSNKIETVALLLGKCDVNKLNSEGETALHMAAYEGYVEIVELLLKQSAKQLENYHKQSPLRKALLRKNDDPEKYEKIIDLLYAHSDKSLTLNSAQAKYEKPAVCHAYIKHKRSQSCPSSVITSLRNEQPPTRLLRG